LLKPEPVAPGKIISTILKHDRKITSYKLALLRAINDTVLAFPDLRSYQQAVAVPLHILAEYWVAYYWAFCDPRQPIYQGQRSSQRQDLDFRRMLTQLRLEWEQHLLAGSPSRPSDGFFLINEFRLPRKRALYPASLLTTYDQTIKTISRSLENPIRYAGPAGEEWSIFDRPIRFDQLPTSVRPVVAVPGTKPTDRCLIIRAELWQTFRDMSLWVEALCIHEWCLFSERIEQESITPNTTANTSTTVSAQNMLPASARIDRGEIYRLLTDRPDNRRPLTWERNQIEVLLMEGKEFTCPWTHKKIHHNSRYDLDHLLPVSVYPVNELWNLVPADPQFNSHIKRDRLPSPARLAQAEPHLVLAYTHYHSSKSLATAIKEDVALRFATLKAGATPEQFSQQLARAVTNLITEVATSRNLTLFN
jgi:hypothetical protein